VGQKTGILIPEQNSEIKSAFGTFQEIGILILKIGIPRNSAEFRRNPQNIGKS
jgi:hypothetical protein